MKVENLSTCQPTYLGTYSFHFISSADEDLCGTTQSKLAGSGTPRYIGCMTQQAQALLSRITYDPHLFGGKPVIRGRRLAVEHVLAQLAAGDTIEILMEGYPWLEREDIQACLAYAQNVLSHEKFVPLQVSAAA